MFKSLIATSLFLGISASSAFAAAPSPTPKCGKNFYWNPQQKICLPVKSASPTPRTIPPRSTAPKPAGSFCQQYPQDPFCGGSIPAPVRPSR